MYNEAKSQLQNYENQVQNSDQLHQQINFLQQTLEEKQSMWQEVEQQNSFL